MKPLKPAHREKKRYLLIKSDSKEIKKQIENAITEFLGLSGMSKTNLRFIEINNQNNTAIISINKNMLEQVKASLCIYNKKLITEKVSGTLKGLRK
ncbi:MAG: Rpp14/Pop5 family protein [Nanoarchaeota archaeon]